MSDSPLMTVSIIITSYNYAQFIGKAIDSCLEQDYPSVEVWVIDGGSTDGTVELLRNYGTRINWIAEHDEGESHAMNKGLDRITGQLVNFLCADNYLTQRSVSRAVDALAQEPGASMAFSDLIVCDAKDRFRYLQKQRNLSFEVMLNHAPSMAQAAAFIRTDLIKRVGGFRQDLRYGNDHELWLRLLREAPGVYVEAPLAVSIEHERTITNRHKLASLWETFRLNREFGAKLFSRCNYHLLKFAIRHLISDARKVSHSRAL